MLIGPMMVLVACQNNQLITVMCAEGEGTRPRLFRLRVHYRHPAAAPHDWNITAQLRATCHTIASYRSNILISRANFHRKENLVIYPAHHARVALFPAALSSPRSRCSCPSWGSRACLKRAYRASSRRRSAAGSDGRATPSARRMWDMVTVTAAAAAVAGGVGAAVAAAAVIFVGGPEHKVDAKEPLPSPAALVWAFSASAWACLASSRSWTASSCASERIAPRSAPEGRGSGGRGGDKGVRMRLYRIGWGRTRGGR